MITFQIEILMFESMPKLAFHLIDRHELSLDVYTVRWFFSFFCIDLPFDYVLSLLDLYMVD